MSDSDTHRTPDETPEAAWNAHILLEEQIISSVLCAGIAIMPGKTHSPDETAIPESDENAPFLSDAAFLPPIVQALHKTIAENGELAALLHRLPQGLGSGEILPVLFANLWPEQREQHKMLRGKKGEWILNKKQVAALRETALGKSQDQVAETLDCSPSNVSQKMKGIRRKLKAATDQEAVAVAISMGYLRMDVMDFIVESAKISVKDFSPLDSTICYMGHLKQTANPKDYQQLAAFGLFLMLAVGAAIAQEVEAAGVPPPHGALYQLTRSADKKLRPRRMDTPGRLRTPAGLAIAPLHARKAGFTPHHIFVTHNRAIPSGRNTHEIVEFTPEGAFVRAFTGGATRRTELYSAKGLAFAASGELLVTTASRLLVFSENGRRVREGIVGCSPAICPGEGQQFYLVHGSTRGDAVGVYSAKGKLLRTMAQKQAGEELPCVQSLGENRLAILVYTEEGSTLEIYDMEGERLLQEPLPGVFKEVFAWDKHSKRFYVPRRKTRDIGIYALNELSEGGSHSWSLTETDCISMKDNIIPHAVASGKDGELWLIGNQSDAPPAAAAPLSTKSE